jgi:hypothetical protein
MYQFGFIILTHVCVYVKQPLLMYVFNKIAYRQTCCQHRISHSFITPFDICHTWVVRPISGWACHTDRTVHATFNYEGANRPVEHDMNLKINRYTYTRILDIIVVCIRFIWLIPPAALSKALACGHWLDGIESSNSDGDVDVCPL